MATHELWRHKKTGRYAFFVISHPPSGTYTTRHQLKNTTCPVRSNYIVGYIPPKIWPRPWNDYGWHAQIVWENGGKWRRDYTRASGGKIHVLLWYYCLLRLWQCSGRRLILCEYDAWLIWKETSSSEKSGRWGQNTQDSYKVGRGRQIATRMTLTPTTGELKLKEGVPIPCSHNMLATGLKISQNELLGFQYQSFHLMPRAPKELAWRLDCYTWVMEVQLHPLKTIEANGTNSVQ